MGAFVEVIADKTVDQIAIDIALHEARAEVDQDMKDRFQFVLNEDAPVWVVQSVDRFEFQRALNRVRTCTQAQAV